MVDTWLSAQKACRLVNRGPSDEGESCIIKDEGVKVNEPFRGDSERREKRVRLHHCKSALYLLAFGNAVLLFFSYVDAPIYESATLGIEDAAIGNDRKKEYHQVASLLLHDGMIAGNETNNNLYSKLLLCGGSWREQKPLQARTVDRRAAAKQHNTSHYLLLQWNLVGACNEGDKNPIIQSVASLRSNQSLWSSCAERTDFTRLLMQNETDKLTMVCPKYYLSHSRLLRHLHHHVYLTNSLDAYDPNVYHMMVMANKGMKGRGVDLWCILDAALRFGEQHKRSKTRWRLEYHNTTKPPSRYVQELFGILGSDHRNDDFHPSVKLRPKYPPHAVAKKWIHRPRGPVSHSFHFRPNTLPNGMLSDISSRISRRIVLDEDVLDRSPPFVLLVLRSRSRRLAGAQTGTASEIIEALLEQSLPLRVIDLEFASVSDQIEWFSRADVVIGMHGAGLTNLIWMRPKQSTLIEIAASYGWGRYLDQEGTCQTSTSELYMKADFYNLARRFGVRHHLIHPVYSSVGPREHHNPIVKDIFYIDAKALATKAKLAFGSLER